MSHQDILSITLLATAAMANAALSLIAGWREKRLWKLVAALPILGVFAVGLNIVLATSRDPTSHNLWPLEVVLWSGVGIIFSITFIVLRRAFSPSKQPSPEATVASQETAPHKGNSPPTEKAESPKRIFPLPAIR